MATASQVLWTHFTPTGRKSSSNHAVGTCNFCQHEVENCFSLLSDHLLHTDTTLRLSHNRWTRRVKTCPGIPELEQSRIRAATDGLPETMRSSSNSSSPKSSSGRTASPPLRKVCGWFFFLK
jgi:hypothetical protein